MPEAHEFFEDGLAVDLPQMLDARERRVVRQRELLGKYGCPMICFTMNIAGPIKNSRLIRGGFRIGKRKIHQQMIRLKMECLHFEETDETTGCTAFYVVNADPMEIKRMTADIENASEAFPASSSAILHIGRLFDMDVLDAHGGKIERESLGLPERTCLICGCPARECARSRAHSAEELQRHIFSALRFAVNDDDAKFAGAAACRALMYEVCVTPKPGLVDRRNNGSHSDMDFFTFIDSVSALRTYFEDCCRIGRSTSSPADTFAHLRHRGRFAEGEMLEATGGINTHKGAVFSLGAVCGALGRLDREQWRDTGRVLDECAAITAGITARDFSDVQIRNDDTAGQRFFAEYGITGVRGQAEAGFPAVRNVGLPILERGLSDGRAHDEAGCAALLAMMCSAEDTNIISRGGIDAYHRVREDTAELLRSSTYPEIGTLEVMDDEFIRRNLSPGGSADLLAMCWLLHFLRCDGGEI